MQLPILLQYLLPQKFLGRVVRVASHWTWRPWKNFLIARFVHTYGVDLGEAVERDLRAYPTFNAFFTRALRSEARPWPDDAATIGSPADGRVSASGRVDDGRMLQAKDRTFSVAGLLGDAEAAASYRDGSFLTVYLSPRDYHRVHMPLDGVLEETLYIPGRLFSVAPSSVAGIPDLFARNERLVCHFSSGNRRFCIVLVGAMLVSGIEVVFEAALAKPTANDTMRQNHRGRRIRFKRGDELGRFNMGSTVITLLDRDLGVFDATLEAGRPLRVGEPAGRLAAADRGPPPGQASGQPEL